MACIHIIRLLSLMVSATMHLPMKAATHSRSIRVHDAPACSPVVLTRTRAHSCTWNSVYTYMLPRITMLSPTLARTYCVWCASNSSYGPSNNTGCCPSLATSSDHIGGRGGGGRTIINYFLYQTDVVSETIFM